MRQDLGFGFRSDLARAEHLSRRHDDDRYSSKEVKDNYFVPRATQKLVYQAMHYCQHELIEASGQNRRSE